MTGEELLDRIDKLMRLAADNPNEHEAKAAALAAQRLIAQYNAQREEPSVVGEQASGQRGEPMVCHQCRNVDVSGKPWARKLASIVARNFRCRLYIDHQRWYRNKVEGFVVFVGYETDAEVASTTFAQLYRMAERLAEAECRRARRLFGTAVGVKNSFLVGSGDGGFVGGIRSALEQQAESLLLVCPKEVDDYFKRVTRDFGTISNVSDHTGYNYMLDAFGFEAGRDAMRRDRKDAPDTRQRRTAVALLAAAKG